MTTRKVAIKALAILIVLALFLPIFPISQYTQSQIQVDTPEENTLSRSGTRSQSILFDVTILDDELVYTDTQSIAFDSVNNRLFVGTSQGLSIVDVESLAVTNLTQSDGLAGDNILGLDYDSLGNRIFMGFVDIPYSLPNERLTIYNSSTSLASNFSAEDGLNGGVRSLAFDKLRNWLYLGTDGFGLAIHNTTNGSFSYRNFTHGLPGNGLVWRLEFDEVNDILYMATAGGLGIYNITNDSIDVRTTGDGLPDNYVIGMELDSLHQLLYITAWNWLSVYDIKNDTFTNYDSGKTWGLGSLSLDSVNHLLYVDVGDGISVFDTEEKTFIDHFDESDGIPLGISSLIWDPKNNNLYAATDSGLAICKSTSLVPPIMNEMPELDFDGDYIVSWTPTENATSYTLEESDEPTFSSAKTIYSGNFTAIVVSEKPDGLYYYRVRASNTTSNSPWSNIQSIEVVHPPDTPLIEAISFPDTDGNYTISWSDISNAEYYVLEEDQNSSFSSPNVLYSGTDTLFNITNRTDGVYYYRVMALNAAGNSSWSSTSVNVVHLPEIPDLFAPPATSNNGTYTISWSSIINANYYELGEDTNSDFLSPAKIYTSLGNSTIIREIDDGTYCYRVRAVNLGGYSNWSEIRSITVTRLPTKPILNLSIIDGQYINSWDSISNADYYLLEECINSNFTSPTVVYNGTNSSFEIDNKDGTYYYRVKAINDAGESDWSNVVTIYIPPNQPDPFFLPFIGTIIIIIILFSILIWQKFRKRLPASSEDEDTEG